MQSSPQLEDGHIRIANELYDAILAYPFTGRQLKVLLSILRKTYGYGKKVDDMSASQIGACCMLPRNHVTQELNRLAELRVIHKQPGKYGSIVGINKDHSAWIDPDALKNARNATASPRTLDAAGEKLHHYVYRITDVRTGQFYIGVRSCDCLPTQDRYMGSGNWVASIDKRQANKDILEIFETRQEAELAEIRHIKSASGQIMNHRMYVSTESVPGRTEPVLVQILDLGRTDSVQGDRTDSVHTKDNLPKDNKQKKNTCANADAFARFWSVYPKKKSKGQAEKAFAKINPSEQLLDAMLAAIERAKTSKDWIKDAGQFIPYPATWLNAKGWEDELPGTAAKGNWWQDAGFESETAAINDGCTQFTYTQFENGQRRAA